jgi:hypothetical protein
MICFRLMSLSGKRGRSQRVGEYREAWGTRSMSPSFIPEHARMHTCPVSSTMPLHPMSETFQRTRSVTKSEDIEAAAQRPLRKAPHATFFIAGQAFAFCGTSTGRFTPSCKKQDRAESDQVDEHRRCAGIFKIRTVDHPGRPRADEHDQGGQNAVVRGAHR